MSAFTVVSVYKNSSTSTKLFCLQPYSPFLNPIVVFLCVAVEGLKSNTIYSICIALFTSNVTEGFTYAHRTAPQPTSTLKEDKEKLPEENNCKEFWGGAIKWGIPSFRDGWLKKGAEHRQRPNPNSLSYPDLLPLPLSLPLALVPETEG